MALVRIDYCNTQPADLRQQLAEITHRVMEEVLKVPPAENFIICQAHHIDGLLHDPAHCTATSLEKKVMLQITLNQGRSAELKQTFFSTLTREICAATGLHKEMIYLNLVEVARENWSFGTA